jgi:hypothetical protein
MPSTPVPTLRIQTTSTPVPTLRIQTPALLLLAEGSPPSNVPDFTGAIVDLLEAHGHGYLLNPDHNRLAAAADTNADAVHTGFTAGVLKVEEEEDDLDGSFGPAKSSSARSASTSANVYGYGGAFYDPRHPGGVVEHASRRLNRMALYNHMKQGFFYHPELLTGSPKGDFHCVLQTLQDLLVNDPDEEFVKALTMLTAITEPAATVNFDLLSSHMKQIQQVLQRKREGNLVVGDQVIVLFFLRALRADKRCATDLALLNKVSLPSLTEALATFQRVFARFEKPEIAPLAFPVVVEQRLCYDEMNTHGNCRRGTSCNYNHDPQAILEAKAKRKHGKDRKDKCAICHKVHPPGVQCSQVTEFQAFITAKAAAVKVPAGHVAQVDELSAEIQRLRLLIEPAPIVASMGIVELGIDHELADMLHYARDN